MSLTALASHPASASQGYGYASQDYGHPNYGMYQPQPAYAPAPAYAPQPNYAYAQPSYAQPNYAAEPATAPVAYGYGFDGPAPLWSGPYVGGHVGGAWADFTNKTPVPGPSGSSGSVTGGGQVGYLWQRNRLVFGVEGDASWLNLSSNTPGTHFHEGYSVTARGRVGYAMGTWLPYATGGVAFTNTRFENAGGSDEEMETGFTVGGGLEKYIAPHWSARVEYLYVDVPRETKTVAGVPIAAGSGNNTVRVGLNYHF